MQNLLEKFSFLVSGISAAGVVLSLLTTEIGPLPTDSTTAVQAGTFLFISITVLLNLWKPPSSIFERIVTILYSYFIFSVVTGGVFLLLYFPPPHL